MEKISDWYVLFISGAVLNLPKLFVIGSFSFWNSSDLITLSKSIIIAFIFSVIIILLGDKSLQI